MALPTSPPRPGFTFFIAGSGAGDQRDLAGPAVDALDQQPSELQMAEADWHGAQDSTGEIRDLYIWWSLGIGTSLFYIIGAALQPDATPPRHRLDLLLQTATDPRLRGPPRFPNNITVVGQCAQPGQRRPAALPPLEAV